MRNEVSFQKENSSEEKEQDDNYLTEKTNNQKKPEFLKNLISKRQNKENLFPLKYCPLNHFRKMQDSLYKYFENTIKENKILKQKNQEFSKKIESLTKEVIF